MYYVRLTIDCDMRESEVETPHNLMNRLTTQLEFEQCSAILIYHSNREMHALLSENDKIYALLLYVCGLRP